MSKEEMQNRKEETYRKILDIAWDIAVKEGLETLSVRKIAAAMHFAPNNLYNYFKDKNELLFQLKKDSYEWTFTTVLNHIPKCETIKEEMEIIIRNLMHIALKEPKRYVVMTSDMIMDSEEPLDIQINKLIETMIAEGVKHGEFRHLDAHITASNIRTTVIAFVRWVIIQKNMTTEKADAYLDNLLEIFWNGMEA